MFVNFDFVPYIWIETIAIKVIFGLKITQQGLMYPFCEWITSLFILQELQQNNLDASVIPVLSFAFTNINVLTNKLTDSKTDDYGGIIFTSPRSVTGFIIAFQQAEKGKSLCLSPQNLNTNIFHKGFLIFIMTHLLFYFF